MTVSRPPTHYVIALAGLTLVPSLASAFNFVPTEAEFLAWPDYCQVAYVHTNIGRSTTYRVHVTQADEISAKRVLGDTSFGGVGVHHYCAGMTLLSRAKLATDPRRRAADLDRAKRETEYTLERTGTDHHMYSAAATQMALIQFEQGQEEKALTLLDQVITVNPDEEMAYTATASIYYSNGQYDLARDILELGDQNLGGTSPDIKYSLGLILVKLGHPELAVEYAHSVYASGYPLPGLRLQLERSGHWQAWEPGDDQ